MGRQFDVFVWPQGIGAKCEDQGQTTVLFRLAVSIASFFVPMLPARCRMFPVKVARHAPLWIVFTGM